MRQVFLKKACAVITVICLVAGTAACASDNEGETRSDAFSLIKDVAGTGVDVIATRNVETA